MALVNGQAQLSFTNVGGFSDLQAHSQLFGNEQHGHPSICMLLAGFLARRHDLHKNAKV
jgi:hypothetical protein